MAWLLQCRAGGGGGHGDGGPRGDGCRAEAEGDFLGAVERCPAELDGGGCGRQAVEAEGHEGVGKVAAGVAVGVVAELDDGCVDAGGGINEVDVVHGAVAAPEGAEAQCQVAVFGNRHPVADYLDWVGAVDRVVGQAEVGSHGLGADAVDPVDIDGLAEAMGAVGLGIGIVDEGAHLPAAEERGGKVDGIERGLLVELEVEGVGAGGLDGDQGVGKEADIDAVVVIVVARLEDRRGAERAARKEHK